MRNGTPEAAGGRHYGLRALRRDDIAAVARLFTHVFRHRDSPAAADFSAYVEALSFGSPLYSAEAGGVVYEGPEGITAALLAVPMQFMAVGRPVVARLLCSFMALEGDGAHGAARIGLSVRARSQELAFSDNAAPVSADHFAAGGGIVLPIQSLDWHRVFRPAAALAVRAGAHKAGLARALLRGLALLVDPLARRLKPSLRPATSGTTRGSEAPLATFFDCARPMIERFAVRPAWGEGEVGWLLGMAAVNHCAGDLHCRLVTDAHDRRIGAVLYYGKAGQAARVLNIVSLPGLENDVVRQVMADLDAAGYAVAIGMAQPFLMNALGRQNWLWFRHRGYFCLTTRYPDIRDAARHGDIYIGGLASESWSRLLDDF
jgi:hypothetical protein